jgi:hypothetical protein
MNSIFRIAAAGLLGLGSAGAAAAQGPRVVGSGENASVVHDSADGGNILGGALVRSIGSGESASVEVLDVQRSQAPGHVVETTGGETGMRAPAPRATLQARGGISG